MIYLLLSIICASLLVISFKLFDRNNIPVFPAIVFNYLAATTTAFIFLPNKLSIYDGSILSNNWIPFALGLGSLFILIFNLTSQTTVQYGVSTASVAMKLGLVFPVLLAFTIYGESYNTLQLFGILLAFVAVVLSSIKATDKSKETSKASFAILPMLVFVGSGTCDSLTQYANKTYLTNSGMEEFSFFLFVAAALIGTILLLVQILSGKVKLNRQIIIGGTLLGIANYFSYLFILKALSTVAWGSSVVFPISNLGTVALTTITGIFFFKEKLSKINFVGLFCALAAIVLIILSRN
jgi:drug/metabolite transporter (DMT)-like permease